MLPLRLSGDPVLHRPCAEWTGAPEQLTELAALLDSVRVASRGIGIAAPQVGISKRVFVARLESGLVIAANPEITLHRGDRTEEEGCLSIPDEPYLVPRATHLTLTALGPNGRFEVSLRGWDARVVQHECDHLAGVLISDRGTRC